MFTSVKISHRVFYLLAILALILVVAPAALAQGPNPEPPPAPLEGSVGQGGGLQVPDTALADILGAKTKANVYIVGMIDDPVVAYEGDIPGLAATKPARGEKIDPNSDKVKKYVEHLDSRHGAALNAVGAGSNKVYDYHYSFNGFSALLTPAQAAALEAQPEVFMVWVDELRQPTTDNSPAFLGLTAEGGLWEMGYTGEDVIIGVIDTGIWPEHPSFSDRTGTNPTGKEGKLDYQQIPGWHGKCVPGDEFNASHCNQKLIGAQYFYQGFGLEDILASGDYLSARDHDGHGTHTASTAGGNYGIAASIFGIDRGTVSGIAPRARIAAYKGCWADAGCAVSDLTAAIDQAVADGVDVINYSIGSSATTLGSDDIAFLFAADAGVFVATSAGNSGPGASTVGSPAWVPWLTSVGASTQDRAFISEITVQGPDEPPTGLWGGSVTQGISNYNLVDAEGIPDSEEDDSGQCLNPFPEGTFQPNDVVLCNQYNFGVPRVERVANVAAGGGGAVIFHNSAEVSVLPTDNHVLPTVHVANDVGQPLKDYILDHAGEVTVSFTQGQAAFAATDSRVKPNVMASFSSRGPNGGAMDIIKPDITAPGVNILAGNTPTPFLGAPGQLFQAIMGTSMSSPHMAGVFALLKQAHPDWSPAMAKSAVMTTAYQDVMKEDGVTPADPFDMGAGHVNPNPAIDPGLVYGAGFLEYLGFLCDAAPEAFADPEGTCNFLASIGIPTDARDLNLASIGIAALAGSHTVQRTVTSVTPGTATYDVSVDAPPGVDVVVSPASLTLNEGDSATYQVTFTTTEAAALNEWAFGSLTWSHGPHHVRSAIAVKPVPLAAPAEVRGAGTEGSLSFDITFGYDGAYTAGTHGLAPADLQPDTVVDDPANDINTALGTCDFDVPFPWPCTGITWHAVSAATGSAYLRISLFDDYTDGNDDLDLYVWDSTFGFVGGSGSATSAEEVNVLLPSDTLYFVAVHGWQTDGPDANYTLFDWSFGLVDDRGNMTVTAPAAATLGATETIAVDWTGLDPDTKYLGAVSHSDASGLLDLTIVRIDTD